MEGLSVIYKYELPIIDGVIQLNLPEDSQFLDIQAIGHKIFMWQLINIPAALKTKEFIIIGTGQSVTNINLFDHLKTVVMPNNLVAHIFQAKDTKSD